MREVTNADSYLPKDAIVRQLGDFIRELEWASGPEFGYEPTCPSCKGMQEFGHEPKCRMAKMIKKLNDLHI